MREGNMKLALC